MKKLIILLLVGVTILFGQNCNKGERPTPFIPKTISQIIAEVQIAFNANNFGLLDPEKLNDSVSRQLLPSWRTAQVKRRGDSIAYVYVPLRPRLLKHGSLFTSVQKNISRQYLLVIQQQNKNSYYLATLLNDDVSMEVADFKGTMLVKDLISQKVVRYNYSQPTKAVAEASLRSAATEESCLYYFTCTFGSFCNAVYTVVGSHGGPSIYQTPPSCPQPYVQECPNNTFTLIHYASTQTCNPDDDLPPLPPTQPDPSGTTGGGAPIIPGVPGYTGNMGPGFNYDLERGKICGTYIWKLTASAYTSQMIETGLTFFHRQYGIYTFAWQDLCVSIPKYGLSSTDASRVWINSWNESVDKVIAELNALTVPPTPTFIQTRFFYWLAIRLQANQTNATVARGPCSGTVPNNSLEFNCL